MNREVLVGHGQQKYEGIYRGTCPDGRVLVRDRKDVHSKGRRPTLNREHRSLVVFVDGRKGM
jgi:hypothetical protein